MFLSQCLDPYQFNPPGGARLNHHIGLPTFEVPGDQRNQLLIGFAIDRRCLHLCSPRAVGLLYQHGASGIGLYFDAKNHCAIFAVV